MQELQNVHLNPSSTQDELARTAQEETIRRRKNHSGSGDGVQFSTIFSMIDSGLDSSAESIRKTPRRASQKETESEKDSGIPVAAAPEAKNQVAEAPKEAPKAKADQEQSAAAEKAAVAKKAERDVKVLSQAVESQAKAETQVKRKTVEEHRAEVQVERQEFKPAEKPKTHAASEAKTEIKERRAESAKEEKGQEIAGQAAVQEQSRGPERRVRVKEKDAETPVEVREERRSGDAQRKSSVEDESARQPKVREKVETKLTPEEAQARDNRNQDRRGAELEISEKREANPKDSAETGGKKRGIGDLEKLTGLKAQTVLEVAPAAAMPMPETGLRAPVEVGARGAAVDSAKSSAKAVPASREFGGGQQHGAADAQAKSAETQDKLGRTAKRLAGYLSGKPEAMVKPETTFADMASKAKLFVENGRSEMTIQLNPEHLGSLKIQMVVEDGKMQANFVTDRAEVKSLIEQNADTLKEKLAEVGIQVDALSVEVRNDAGSATPQDDRPSGLRKVTEFGSGGDSGLPGSADAQIAYALAGMGTHLSLVG